MPMIASDGRRTPDAVAVDDATVVLGGRPVLRRVSLRVGDGEFVALLGANGSGKSTLVRACVGLVPLLDGSVHLLGSPLDQFRDWGRVGYVPQRPSAASGVPATVREVVATGRLSGRPLFRGGSTRDRRAVDRALGHVGLTDRTRDSVADLSGGQQQRVMIARALAGEPDLLLLDEPTAGVDHETQHVLADLFTDLVAAGSTVLLVAHELGPLERLVDRTVVLRDGRVAYDGPPLATLGARADHPHAHAASHAHDQVLGGEGMWR